MSPQYNLLTCIPDGPLHVCSCSSPPHPPHHITPRTQTHHHPSTNMLLPLPLIPFQELPRCCSCLSTSRARRWLPTKERCWLLCSRDRSMKACRCVWRGLGGGPACVRLQPPIGRGHGSPVGFVEGSSSQCANPAARCCIAHLLLLCSAPHFHWVGISFGPSAVHHDDAVEHGFSASSRNMVPTVGCLVCSCRSCRP